VCQRLVRGSNGGRVPCVEVLVNTGRISERIADPKKTSEIEQVIAEGDYYGMRTFDQSLVELVRRSEISVEDAMEAATSPHDLELLLKSSGVVEAGLSFAR
jgi:twitching motility protein PilT